MHWLLALLLLVVPDGPTVREIRARGKLVVSVKNDGVPQPQLHKDPAHFQKRGFELDLAHALAKRLVGDASKVELRLLPKAKRLAAVEGGGVDLVISMIAITDERKREVDFSEPYYAGGLFLMVPRASTVQGLRDLEGKNIAVVAANAKNEAAELQQLGHPLVEVVPKFEAAVEDLRTGRAAALASQYADLSCYLDAHPTSELRIVSKAVRRDVFAVAIQKGHPDLVAAVNEVIRELRQSGELRRIAAKWKLPYLL